MKAIDEKAGTDARTAAAGNAAILAARAGKGRQRPARTPAFPGRTPALPGMTPALPGRTAFLAGAVWYTGGALDEGDHKGRPYAGYGRCTCHADALLLGSRPGSC